MKSKGYAVAIIFSKRSKEERDEYMIKFRKGELGIVITTDLLARGIDIPTIMFVVNFDIPT